MELGELDEVSFGRRFSFCLVKQQMQLVMAIKRVKEDTIISVS